jgi:eukaryotic-like serine/threonine-protein kinase
VRSDSQSGRPDRLRDLFCRALELDPAAQKAFLDEACAGDDGLRAEVESLLCEREEASDFFEAPAWRSDLLPPGTRIGRYRIERLLGEGGMGQVYLARQDLPEREVALKLIRPGLMSRSLSRRFEQEAHLLGLMQHPGIAQVYEAGTADTSWGPQPFFAMEYIEGRSISDYVRDGRLDIHDRLQLFVKVCEAVHHAHLKGVIHRDLKPDNILVDGSCRPRILDFGVARATDSDLRTTTLQTGMGQLIGTIPYMSPEQVIGDPVELDTRSDIYSLGVVCYELLADRLPQEFRDSSIPEAARLIREVDPTRLSSIDRLFRGDIEIICMKALAKEKERRYQSAAQFASDIKRYLNNEPIEARPASTIYQLRKFTRRNRGLVAGVCAAFLLLILGTAGTSWQAFHATRSARLAGERLVSMKAARQRAEERVEETEEVTAFLEELLSSLSPRDLGRDVRVQDVLDRASRTLEASLSDRPVVEARLNEVLGRSYRELGLFDKAAEHLIRAHKIRLARFGENHRDTLQSMQHLALLDKEQGLYPKVKTEFERIYAMSRASLGDSDPFTIEVMSNLARACLNTGDVEQAATVAEAAVEAGRRSLDESHPITVESMETLAELRYYQRDLPGAQALFEGVVEIRLEILGDSHPDTLSAMNGLAIALSGQKLWRKSETIHRRMLSIKEDLLGPSHPHTLVSMYNLALLLQKQDHFEESETLLKTAIDRSRSNTGLSDDHWCLGTLLSIYGSQLITLERFEEAEPCLLEALDIMTDSMGSGHVERRQCLQSLISLYRATGRPQEASSCSSMLERAEKRAEKPPRED